MKDAQTTLREFCGYLSARDDVPECGGDAVMDADGWTSIIDEYLAASPEVSEAQPVLSGVTLRCEGG